MHDRSGVSSSTQNCSDNVDKVAFLDHHLSCTSHFGVSCNTCLTLYQRRFTAIAISIVWSND